MTEEANGVPIPPQKGGEKLGKTELEDGDSSGEEETPAFERKLGNQNRISQELHSSLRDLYGEDAFLESKEEELHDVHVAQVNDPFYIPNPFVQEEQTLNLDELTEMLQRFYRKYNKKKLEKGLGSYIKFVDRFGVNALNRRLMKQYGADLNMSIEAHEERIREEQRRRAKEQEKQKEFMKVKAAVGTFLKKHDRRRMIAVTPVLLQYCRERGATELSRFVKNRYGEELPGYPTTVREGEVLQYEIDVSLLILFYKKHNKKFLKDAMKRQDRRSANLEGVLQWVRINGVGALDIELEKKYGETYTDFEDKTNRLRSDIQEFREAIKNEHEIENAEQILEWAVVHGRQSLNYELYQRYGRHLDSDLVQEWEEEAARIGEGNDGRRVSF